MLVKKSEWPFDVPAIFSEPFDSGGLFCNLSAFGRSYSRHVWMSKSRMTIIPGYCFSVDAFMLSANQLHAPIGEAMAPDSFWFQRSPMTTRHTRMAL